VLDKSAFDIIGPYYASPPAAAVHIPGRIYETRVYYFPPGSLNVLKFDYEAANRGESVKYDVGPGDATAFDHIPVRLPRPLQRDEAFGVVTVSNRRVVLLSNPVEQPRGAPRQDFPASHLVCPMFRFHDTHDAEFRLRVQAWEYEWLFHLPENIDFGVIEGFLRLDRIVAIPLGQLRPTNVMLTANAFMALRECLNCFAGGTMDADFAEYRRLLLEELNRVLGHSTESTTSP
jgi:hypothetical protein